MEKVKEPKYMKFLNYENLRQEIVLVVDRIWDLMNSKKL